MNRDLGDFMEKEFEYAIVSEKMPKLRVLRICESEISVRIGDYDSNSNRIRV